MTEWRLREQALTALGLGVILTIIGPYGTYAQMNPVMRLFYWGGLMVIGWGQFLLLAHLLRRVLPWPPMARAALGGCLGSLPLTGEVMLLNYGLHSGQIQTINPAGLYFLVLALALPLSLVLARSKEGAQPPPEPDRGPLSAGSDRFFSRLPPRLGRDLLCLRAEDHYLRIYTVLGDDLILMRMTDAETELAGTGGLRVHRSWWVAPSAVESSERQPGGKVELILRNGLRIPVARNAVGALRAAGWISPP